MDHRAAAWARGGAATLSGHTDGPPLPPPAALVDVVARAAGVLDVDGLALLGERAALAGLGRRGAISCGGGTRLLRAADGWIAVALVRPEDLASVPAWLELDEPPGDDPWAAVAAAVAGRAVALLDERAGVLGLPAAALGSVAATPDDGGLPVTAHRFGAAGVRAVPLVVDLSALWAGPLCAQLLGGWGARVVKVESTARPDGTRRDPSGFHDLLNAGKESVALDLGSAEGVADLGRLVRHADVVVEGSRPRALEQLGLDAAALLAGDGRPAVWISITGFGRGPGRDRVAFGDVAAVAGGLVTGDAAGPCFCADAVADPLAGLVAAAAATRALAAGRKVLLDVSMAGVAAAAATGERLCLDGLALAPPRARARSGAARPFGADTAAILAELGAGRG